MLLWDILKTKLTPRVLWKIERVAFRFKHPIGSNLSRKCGKLSQFTHVRKKKGGIDFWRRLEWKMNVMTNGLRMLGVQNIIFQFNENGPGFKKWEKVAKILHILTELHKSCYYDTNQLSGAIGEQKCHY